MSLWFLIFLSVLQGVTELFPVSSLGHTLLVPALFGMHIDKHAPQLIPFLVALHLGTALALLGYFRQRWIALIRGFFASLGGRRNDDGHMMWALIIGTVPAGLVGILLDNLPGPAAVLARWLVFPLGARFKPPSDRLGQRAARAILEDREARLRLTEDIHVPGPDEPGLGALEAALDKAVRALPVETKLRDAVRAGRLDRGAKDELDERARAAGIISREEYAALNEAAAARDAVVQVDAFDPATYRQLR